MWYSGCFDCGGDTASTWALKHEEHTGEHEDFVKTCTYLFGNEYQLAA